MKKDEMKKFISDIESKLGSESASIISDDLGVLITDNEAMNNEIEKRDVKIREQNDLNKKLVSANSSLLRQVGTASSEDFEVETKTKKDSKSEEEEKISWSDCFDSKGRFLK